MRLKKALRDKERRELGLAVEDDLEDSDNEDGIFDENDVNLEGRKIRVRQISEEAKAIIFQWVDIAKERVAALKDAPEDSFIYDD